MLHFSQHVYSSSNAWLKFDSEIKPSAFDSESHVSFTNFALFTVFGRLSRLLYIYIHLFYKLKSYTRTHEIKRKTLKLDVNLTFLYMAFRRIEWLNEYARMSNSSSTRSFREYMGQTKAYPLFNSSQEVYKIPQSSPWRQGINAILISSLFASIFSSPISNVRSCSKSKSFTGP